MLRFVTRLLVYLYITLNKLLALDDGA